MAELGGRPRGIFDRSTTGFVTPAVSVQVERDRIRFLASVLEEHAAVHHHLEAARAAGYPDLLAPPSFPFTIEMAADEERRRLGLATLPELIGCDMRHLLHGSEQNLYARPIFAGDEVELVSRVIGFSDRKGGLLEVADLETEIRHAVRGRLVTIRRTLIHRLG